MAADLLVIGSGSLARALCNSLAVTADTSVTVTVLGRDAARTGQVAYIANARSALARRDVDFRARTGELADGACLDRAIHDLSPRVVVQCASLHSPWEGRATPSPWTALVAAAGFGITLPLQARLAVATGESLRRTGSDARFVNACFPDAVNPVLHRLGLPVFCGIGNVATLAGSLQSALGVPAERLRVLAHHVHLHAPRRPEDEVRAWLDDVPVPGVGTLLAAQRAADRVELNQVTGLAGARLVADLLSGAEIVASLPGPLGRPGGYPVRITRDRLDLDLPTGLTEEEATAFNEHAGESDGIRIGPDRVCPTAAAAHQLTAQAPELVDGFAIQDVIAAAARLDGTRSRLRTS
ncbi:MAG: potassium transporter TrkA [Actinocatenispora sp.]